MAWLEATALQAQESPAAQAYERLSAAHDQAAAVRKSSDSPQARSQAETILLKALDDARSAPVQALADGSKPLRYRAYDLRSDLFRLYVDEGDKAKALDMMAANLAQDAAPADTVYRSKQAQALLHDEPRYQAMLAGTAAMDRLWHDKAFATPYVAQLSAADRVAGLSLFWSEAKHGFAHFSHVPQLDWDQAYLDFLPQVMAASDTRAYYEVMMRFAPLLHDGHTNIYPPKALRKHFYARPPLRTALVGDKVLVTFVGSDSLEKQGIHAGDEITAIDGIEIKRYAHERVEPYQSSSTPQDLLTRAYGDGLLAGDQDTPVGLSLDDGHGHRRSVTVSRGDYPDRREPAKFEFRTLPGGVAYLSIDDFEADTSSKAFEQHLPQIMQAKALVLDLRHNSGGSDSNAFNILTHLTEAPIPGPRSSELAVSPVARANDELSLEWQPADGSGASYPHQTTPIFRGPVAVLTSAATFSAGEDFVMIFDSLKRGPVIGQTTGGSTGMPMSFALPGGGFARICVKWDRYPDGRDFVGTGIKPGIELAPSVADLRAGRDPVLERARHELLKSL